jgi:enoyl-CoA hydratase/carnithine racemase
VSDRRGGMSARRDVTASRADECSRRGSSLVASPRMQRIEGLEVRDEGAVRIIALDRPEKRNCFTEGVATGILDALAEAGASDDLRVVVFTGNGGVFSAGIDVSVLMSVAETQKLPSSLSSIEARLRTFEKPLIAALDGLAVGMAVTILPAFDMVYASERTELTTPFSKLGLCVEYGGSVTFPRLMGRQRASEMLLRGARIDARTLEAWGFLTRVFPTEGFMEEVLTIARDVAALPPGSVAATKRLLRDGEERTLDEAFVAESEELAARFRSPEMIAAVGAFLKR